MINKKGLAASDGIAIGRAILLNKVNIFIEDKVVENTPLELEKFYSSLEKTKQKISKIKEKVTLNLGENEGTIFDGHLEILEDPSFIGEIEQIIKNDHKNSLFAVSQVSSKYIDIFKKMDNEYMSQRASDIQDISTNIMNYLANVETIDLSNINQDSILIAEDITPSQTAQIDKNFVKAFISEIGGKTSHAAIMARSLEIPSVLGVQNIVNEVKTGDLVLVDGTNGIIIINPDEKTKNDFLIKQKQYWESKLELRKNIGKPTKTLDGHSFKLFSNIGNIFDINKVLENDAEGIGLFRTEFLYMESKDWPTEEQQFQSYKNILLKMQNKEVIFRTFDIGGDKNLSYYKFESEMNPFLGNRAIRFCLKNIEIFKNQIRALLRASKYGLLKIMFPMIATIEEVINIKSIYLECQEELKNKQIDFNKNIEIGMMVEIPSTIMLIEQFSKYVDFFSIGTNDLIQYTMAADRMNEKVSYLYQPLNPAILKMIYLVITKAHENKKWVGVCGEMGGDQNAIPFLIGMGLDEFSMSASLILKSRSLISKINYQDAKELVKKSLTLDTQEEILKELEEFKKRFKI